MKKSGTTEERWPRERTSLERCGRENKFEWLWRREEQVREAVEGRSEGGCGGSK